MPTPRLAVAPSPRVRHRAGSLLETATIIRGRRWGGGIAYRPELAQTGDSRDPCNPDNPKTAANTRPLVEWDPYVIWVEDECSTLTGEATYQDLTRSVMSTLDTQESYLIEQILWTGFVDGTYYGAGGKGHPNVGLADTTAASLTYPTADAAAGTPVGIVEGLSDMVAALTVGLGGARGFIHVPATLIPYLMFYGLAVRNGQLLQVAGTDHLIVAGTGYDGSDPNGNTFESWVWIYGTSPIDVYLSSPYVVPGDESEAINRTTNLVEVRAEKLAMATWDLQAHYAIPVCIPDPGPDCSPSGS